MQAIHKIGSPFCDFQLPGVIYYDMQSLVLLYIVLSLYVLTYFNSIPCHVVVIISFLICYSSNTYLRLIPCKLENVTPEGHGQSGAFQLKVDMSFAYCDMR